LNVRFDAASLAKRVAASSRRIGSGRGGFDQLACAARRPRAISRKVVISDGFHMFVGVFGGRNLSWVVALLSLTIASATHAEDSLYGTLDFSRLTPNQEQFFWRRLEILADEEAVLAHCGQADDSRKRAIEGVRACVTSAALEKADAFFTGKLKERLRELESDHWSCSATPVAMGGWLGVGLRNPTKAGVSEEVETGAVVEDVFDGSPAARADIRTGDVITSLNDQKIATPAQLSKEIASMSPHANAKLAVVRNGAPQVVNVTLGEIGFDAHGKIARDAPALLNTAKTDLRAMTDEVTRMCQSCKSTIFAAFCH
jgi:PDZ domain